MTDNAHLGSQKSASAGRNNLRKLSSGSDRDLDTILVAKQSNGIRTFSKDHHRNVNLDDSEDELQIEDDSDEPRRSKRLTNQQHPRYADHDQYPSQLLDSDSQMSPPKLYRRRNKVEGNRRNGSRSRSRTESSSPHPRRTTRTRRQVTDNMRERQEDDFSSQSEAEKKARISGAREIFFRISLDDPFRQAHQQDCSKCSEGENRVNGPLIFCQGCTSSYHRACLGPRSARDHLVTKIGIDVFVLQCRRCIGVHHAKDSSAPHYGLCETCHVPGSMATPLSERKTAQQEHALRAQNGGIDPITSVELSVINNTENILLRCRSCHRAWHTEHLSTEDNAHGDHDSVSQTLSNRSSLPGTSVSFKEALKCDTCVKFPDPITSLVAWRPTNQDTHDTSVTLDQVAGYAKEFLVKWRNTSHFSCTWMPGTWVHSMTPPGARVTFAKKPENQLPKLTTEDAIPEDFYRIDIVFDVQYTHPSQPSSKEAAIDRIGEVEKALVKFKGLSYEDSIWEKPPLPSETERWTDFKIAYDDFVAKQYMLSLDQGSLRSDLAEIRLANFEDDLLRKIQPKSLIGGDLMQYQLEGLNWLYYQWYRQHNAILADEMGLGKTIQLIAFCATLIEEHNCWPFLIVVPNSTCPNWRREFKKWAPSLRAVCYYGSAYARKLTHDYELFPVDHEEDDLLSANASLAKARAKSIKAHIVITSYESINDDRTRRSLKHVPWQGLIVDEGQRLKNDASMMYEGLSELHFPFKVLMTGTPLQNNARELFNLLQFLDQDKHDAEELEEQYAELSKEKVSELHEMLKPYFLRRTKVQVLKFLPPIAQIIIPVSMSSLQKKVSKSIMGRDPHLLRSILSRAGRIPGKDRAMLNNMLMQLRKTLCHPFVYSPEIEDRTADAETMFNTLVAASSKLQLLSIMLPKLRARGHRVLMFSQFLDNLDIIEDFLTGYGFKYKRLDGTMNAMEKQKRIDIFNDPNSNCFAFLLSTRAGGVGINLATADTVIILDPDFNPHQDMQALSRAHRIGQKNKVLVFQLVTRDSVEEKVLQIAKKKLALDKVLIEAMDHKEEDQLDVESVLRHGAEALFGDDDGSSDILYDDTSVEKLLDRSLIETSGVENDKQSGPGFSFAKIWTNEKDDLQNDLEIANNKPSNSNVWENIIKEREMAYAQEIAQKQEQLGRGKRKRGNVNYGRYGVRGLGKDGEDMQKAQSDEDRNDKDFEALAIDVDSSSDDDRDDAISEGSPERVSKQAKLSTPQKPQIPSHFVDGPSDSATSVITLDHLHRDSKDTATTTVPQTKPLSQSPISSHTVGFSQATSVSHSTTISGMQPVSHSADIEWPRDFPRINDNRFLLENVHLGQNAQQISISQPVLPSQMMPVFPSHTTFGFPAQYQQNGDYVFQSTSWTQPIYPWSTASLDTPVSNVGDYVQESTALWHSQIPSRKASQQQRVYDLEGEDNV